MRGLALTGVYMASIGLVVLAIENGYIPETSAGPLFMLWALVGLGAFVYGVTRGKS
jgi:hypothetical protein